MSSKYLEPEPGGTIRKLTSRLQNAARIQISSSCNGYRRGRQQDERTLWTPAAANAPHHAYCQRALSETKCCCCCCCGYWWLTAWRRLDNCFTSAVKNNHIYCVCLSLIIYDTHFHEAVPLGTHNNTYSSSSLVAHYYLVSETSVQSKACVENLSVAHPATVSIDQSS